jgi:hypothetical protein
VAKIKQLEREVEDLNKVLRVERQESLFVFMFLFDRRQERSSAILKLRSKRLAVVEAGRAVTSK